MKKYEHIIVNITNFKCDNKIKSLPKQVLEYFEKDGWQLCAVDDIYYFFKRLIY